MRLVLAVCFAIGLVLEEGKRLRVSFIAVERIEALWIYEGKGQKQIQELWFGPGHD